MILAQKRNLEKIDPEITPPTSIGVDLADKPDVMTVDAVTKPSSPVGSKFLSEAKFHQGMFFLSGKGDRMKLYEALEENGKIVTRPVD